MKNIAVLMGGYSSEKDISMKSGKVISKYLNKDLYQVYEIVISEQSWSYISTDGEVHEIDKNDFSITINDNKVIFDCCYNTIHGTPGEDGLLQAYLELIGLPQTSCDSYQSAITFNKRDCIAVLKPWGITTAQSVYLNQSQEVDVNLIVDRVGLPCFVKANRSGSSYGVSKVYQIEQLPAALDVAFAVDNEIIIESFLDGIEVSVGVYKKDGTIIALPPTEIVSENDFFDYEAKYQGKSQEITPARISERMTVAVQELSKRIYELLNCKGIARADFIFHQGTPHFIEINTNPGMSEESIVPKQVEASNQSLTDFLTDIIEETLN
ncbi:D-alanine-D-alanine ligase [Nonlabens tegetincola]|uniref:D-alanine--D-alanine ligase n=1 Tax=Nonlabens tegetincola TaxID=323273 RepID=A0A090Q6A4_9FLAO|nr:D-alanine--D-alanine ligase [Nonlabens tegetincola]GAK97288.1 D-alanine-D-alanine ligase [Nonlabens tegetincola]